MTFAGNRNQAFRGPEAVPPRLGLRPESKLKKYSSAADIRSWTEDPQWNEDRRQHILEVIRAETMVRDQLQTASSTLEFFRTILDSASRGSLFSGRVFRKIHSGDRSGRRDVR